MKRQLTTRANSWRLVSVFLLLLVFSFGLPAAGSWTPVGTYIDPLIPDNILEVRSNGRFYMEAFGLNIGDTGRWSLRDRQISLRFSDGTTLRGEVDSTSIVLQSVPMLTIAWVRDDAPYPSPQDVVGEYEKTGSRQEHLILTEDMSYSKVEIDLFGDLTSEEGYWDLDNHVIRLTPSGTLFEIEIEGVYVGNTVALPGMLEMHKWERTSPPTTITQIDDGETGSSSDPPADSPPATDTGNGAIDPPSEHEPESPEVTDDGLFWARVRGPGTSGILSIRSDHGIPDSDEPDTTLKLVPTDWVLRVMDTHDDAIQDDEFIWWEVKDTTEDLQGWVAAYSLEDKTSLLIAFPDDILDQTPMAQQADPSYADTYSERIEIIVEAVEHYYGDSSTSQSLYSSDDKDRNGGLNRISSLKKGAFPLEVIYAIIVQESGGAGTGHANTSDGVMQINWPASRGLASNILCYEASGAWYYGKTRQAIYANVKDGLKDLRNRFIGEDSFILAAWKYNAGNYPFSTYCEGKGDPYYVGRIGARLSGSAKLDGENMCDGSAFTWKDGSIDPCDIADSTTPTIEEFGMDLRDDLADQFKEFQADNVTVYGCSPVSVHLTDALGRSTRSQDAHGSAQLPDAVAAGSGAIVFQPERPLKYVVVGTGDGEYTLVANDNQESRYNSLAISEQSIRQDSVHEFEVDWDALEAGEAGVLISIDEDGDGSIDSTRTLALADPGVTYFSWDSSSQEQSGPDPTLLASMIAAVSILALAALFLRFVFRARP